jgi:transposase
MARSKELTPTIRARICELHDIGWGYKRIHTRYPQIPLSTIQYTIKKENQRNDQQSLPRSGRPKALTSEQQNYLLDLATKDPHIKMRELQIAVDTSPSKSTVRRLFRNLHMRKWKQRNRPEIKEENAIKRLQWAQTYAHYTPDDWRRVKWTDECSVERGKGVQTIWTFNSPSQQLIEHDVHGIRCGKGVKKMFWAGFGYNIRTGLVPLDGDPESRRGGDNFLGYTFCI